MHSRQAAQSGQPAAMRNVRGNAFGIPPNGHWPAAQTAHLYFPNAAANDKKIKELFFCQLSKYLNVK